MKTILILFMMIIILSGCIIGKNKTFTRIDHAINKSERCYRLDLSDSSLNELPASVTKLEKLEHLNLNNNELFIFSFKLLELNNLKSLSLRGNGIKDVPLMIYKLNKLESISLRNNPIENLPIEMFRMKDHLKVINLVDTNISMRNRKIILDSFPNQLVIFDLIQ